MNFLDINGKEIELGSRIAWISHSRKWTGNGYKRETEIKEGVLDRMTQSRRGGGSILTVFVIEHKHQKYNYLQRIACYKSGRLGVLTGNYDEDSQTLEKLSHLDDRPQV